VPADLKERVREIVRIPSAPDDAAGRFFDALIITLILANTFVLIAETVSGFGAGYESWLFAFEWFSVAVFVVEYLLRVWSITADPTYAHPVRGRLRWMATPMAIIDILAILPAFLTLVGIDLRFLRVLRMLRIVKLGRYADSFVILGNVLQRSRRELITSGFLVGLALLLTSSFMYYAEKDVQPESFSSIPRAMWWGVITLTTTGYGDVVPMTALGRVLGGMTAVLGVAAIALPIGILSSAFVQEIEARRKQREASGKGFPCPHCGKDIMR